jgi:hypothetical protein
MTPADIGDDAAILSVRELPLGRYVIDRCELDGDCWRWLDSVNNYGYPQTNTSRFGKGMPHRMLVALLRQQPIDGRRERLQNVCGMRRCCNPAHWRVVSVGKVISDQYRLRQRGSQERLRVAALRAHTGRQQRVGSFEKAAEARAMRAAGATGSQIAKHFGVSKNTALRWADGRAWAPASPFGGLARK